MTDTTNPDCAARDRDHAAHTLAPAAGTKPGAYCPGRGHIPTATMSLRPGITAGASCRCGWHSHTRTHADHLADLAANRGAF